MCSWVPKKGKLVLLLSTFYQTNEIAQSRKPEIIEFYNQTKASVDALDQKVRQNSTYQKTKHWPQAVFYNILDIAAYNTYVLFKLRPSAQGFNFEQRARYKFLAMLGEARTKTQHYYQITAYRRSSCNYYTSNTSLLCRDTTSSHWKKNTK